MKLPNNLTAEERRWVEWRVAQGLRKDEAIQALRQRRETIDSVAGQRARTHYSPGKILHLDKLHKWPVAHDKGDTWSAFLDTLPRRPYTFLAMVAEAERKREVAAKVATKRKKGRARYERRMQRATTATRPAR